MASIGKPSATSKIQTNLYYKAKSSITEREKSTTDQSTRKKYQKKILSHVANLIDSTKIEPKEEDNVPIMHMALEKKIREDLLSVGSYDADECNIMAKKMTAFIEDILKDSSLSRSSSKVSCSEKEISGNIEQRNMTPSLKYLHLEKKSNQIINIEEVEDLQKAGIVPLGNAVQYESKNEGKFEVEEAQMGDKIVTLVRKEKASPLSSFVRECSTWMIDVTDIHSEWSDWALKKEKSSERSREEGLLRESTSSDLTQWGIPKQKESISVKQRKSTTSTGRPDGAVSRDLRWKEDTKERLAKTKSDDSSEESDAEEEMKRKSGLNMETTPHSKQETKSSKSSVISRLDKYIEQIANLSRIHRSQIDRLKGSLTTTDLKRSDRVLNKSKGGIRNTYRSDSNENFQPTFMSAQEIKEGGSSTAVGPIFYNESKSKNYHSSNCLSQLRPSDSLDGQ